MQPTTATLPNGTPVRRTDEAWIVITDPETGDEFPLNYDEDGPNTWCLSCDKASEVGYVNAFGALGTFFVCAACVEAAGI